LKTAILQAFDRMDKPNMVRKEGFVPGVVYGADLDSTKVVKFDAIELNRRLSKKGTDLSMPIQIDNQQREVIIKEIQRDPINNNILHIDLQAIRKDEVVKVNIPVEIKGRDVIEQKGMIVEQFTDMVEINGPLNLLPEVISIDISSFDVGDSFRVGDIQLEDQVAILNSPEETILVVSMPRIDQDDEENEADTDGGLETETDIEA
jgi:large subunit ribosomal protein L25